MSGFLSSMFSLHTMILCFKAATCSFLLLTNITLYGWITAEPIYCPGNFKGLLRTKEQHGASLWPRWRLFHLYRKVQHLLQPKAIGVVTVSRLCGPIRALGSWTRGEKKGTGPHLYTRTNQGPEVHKLPWYLSASGQMFSISHIFSFLDRVSLCGFGCS